MNQLQTEYLKLKKQMAELEQAENWEALEEIEDQFLDAELDLIEWAISEVAKTDTNAAETLKNNWTDNVEKITKLALNLKVA